VDAHGAVRHEEKGFGFEESNLIENASLLRGIERKEIEGFPFVG